jgi:hypothetical protein
MFEQSAQTGETTPPLDVIGLYLVTTPLNRLPPDDGGAYQVWLARSEERPLWHAPTVIGRTDEEYPPVSGAWALYRDLMGTDPDVLDLVEDLEAASVLGGVHRYAAFASPIDPTVRPSAPAATNIELRFFLTGCPLPGVDPLDQAIIREGLMIALHDGEPIERYTMQELGELARRQTDIQT